MSSLIISTLLFSCPSQSYCDRKRPGQLKFSRSADNQQTSMAANTDYGELVWENGQIVMKGGQSHEVSRFPNRDNFTNSKTGKFGSMLVLDDVVAGGDDSDMPPWFCHLDDTLGHMSSEVLPMRYTNFSTINRLSNPAKEQASVALDSETDRSNLLSLTYPGSRVSSVVGDGICKYALESDSLEDQLSEMRLHKKQDKEVCDLGGLSNRDTKNFSHFSLESDSLGDQLSEMKLHKKQDKEVCDLGGRSKRDSKNFSHFPWSAARAKNNVKSDGATASDRFLTHETAPANDEMLVDTNKQTIDATMKDLPSRPAERQANAFRAESGLKLNQVSGNAEMIKKPAAAPPSICSDNSGVRGSNTPSYHLKRKHNDEEDWEDSSDDAEEPAIIKNVGSKRNRAAEVHNLTERKRREKINEKMRALQELIPYCNKVDKATMLDEAIEYLRVLQLQVQMMSMRAQMCAMPMMPQSGPQQLHDAVAPLWQFLPMGMGYQAGALDMTIGFPVQDVCFPGLSKTPPILWNAAQGLPMAMPGLLVPMPGAPPPLVPGSAVTPMTADETPNPKDPHQEETI